MKIEYLIRPDYIKPSLTGTTKTELLAELVGALRDGGALLDVDQHVRLLEERERLGSTGIGHGVAIPHCKSGHVDELLCSFGVHPTGVDFDAIDGHPVRIFFCLIVPDDPSGLHLKALARISRLAKDPAFRSRVVTLDTAASMYELMRAQDG